MFLRKVKSEGIAHLSYIVGDGNQAAVIDPRRDCAVYTEIAAREGVRITHIFETHRNEDYVIGSLGLAQLTGASVYHGSRLDFRYGKAVYEGDKFEFGNLGLTVLETPGHTMESISLVLSDNATGGPAVGVFTGDALFVGDVGRTDFYPDHDKEVAGLLYDSVFGKLLPLGDQAMVFPGHGSGSVCGGGLAAREFSTLGHERVTNPSLQYENREAFIAKKIAERHYKPPYFKKMEHVNFVGAPHVTTPTLPNPLNAEEIADALAIGATIIDLRSPEAFAGAFIPGSLAIPLDLLPAYAGYFIDYENDLILVPESRGQLSEATRHLFRLGYDRITGYLDGGMHEWEVSGRPYDNIRAVHTNALSRRLISQESMTILDVRSVGEFEETHLEGATHIFLGDLPQRFDELDREKPVVTFCGSGARAIIAASILKRKGFTAVEDCLGSLQACKQTGCRLLMR